MTNKRHTPNQPFTSSELEELTLVRQIAATAQVDAPDLRGDAAAMTSFFLRADRRIADICLAHDLGAPSTPLTPIQRLVLESHLWQPLTEVFEVEGHIDLPLDDLFSQRRSVDYGIRYTPYGAEGLFWVEWCQRLVAVFVEVGVLALLEGAWLLYRVEDQVVG